MSSIQKQLSLLFDNPRKYQNGYTYYVDLDNDLYEIYVENHEPIIHNKINNYELILDSLDIKLGGY